MRYLLVTFDETNLPSPSYDPFEEVGRFLADEGIEGAGIACFSNPRRVQEEIAAGVLAEGGDKTQQVLLTILNHLEIAQDEMQAVSIVSEEADAALQAAYDELATASSLITEALNPVTEEAA